MDYENTLRNMSGNKKMVIGKMMPHDMMMMLKFASVSDFNFNRISCLKGNDWFLYGACKEDICNTDDGEEKPIENGGLLTPEQFAKVAENNPSKALCYELYKAMWECEDVYLAYKKEQDDKKAKAKAEKKKWMDALPRLSFKKVVIRYGEMDYESWEGSTEAEELPDDEARKTAWLKMCKAYEGVNIEIDEEDGDDDIEGEEIWDKTREVYDNECVE
jgi:hypothetical protein